MSMEIKRIFSLLLSFKSCVHTHTYAADILQKEKNFELWKAKKKKQKLGEKLKVVMDMKLNWADLVILLLLDTFG